MAGKVFYLHTPMAQSPDQQPNRVRYWRKQRGLTLEQLGDRIGVGKVMMSAIERGNRKLDRERIIAIARELEIDPADVFLSSETPNTVPPGERDFWANYTALDAHGRRHVRMVAENLMNWGAPEPADRDADDADDADKTRRA
jgi:transcriptional regulator with XRE-family HTH domain